MATSVGRKEMSTRLYDALDVESGPNVMSAPPPPQTRCSSVGHAILGTVYRAGRFCVNAFALTMGAAGGAYVAVYVLSQIAPVTLHVALDLPGVGPNS